MPFCLCPSGRGRFLSPHEYGTYINRQGVIQFRRMSQLAYHLLWSQQHLKSLRATRIPGDLNLAVETSSPGGSADL